MVEAKYVQIVAQFFKFCISDTVKYIIVFHLHILACLSLE